MTTEQYVLYGATITGVLAVIYGLGLVRWINVQSAGEHKMIQIAEAIQQGAKAYLNRQYKTISIVALIAFVALGLFLTWKIAAGFLLGAVLSAISGYIGMNVSV